MAADPTPLEAESTRTVSHGCKFALRISMFQLGIKTVGKDAACSYETESLMPPTFDISRNIQMALWEIQNNDEKLDLDSKVQVTTGGEETKVVISTQHKKDIDIGYFLN